MSSGPTLALESVPCANGCKEKGSKACSACRLVSYCSETCQKAHWKTHKAACKNPMKLKDWQPAWVVEGRLPAFFGGEVEQDERDKKGDLEHGCTLWGNTPAFDVVNLVGNENKPSVDLALAFPASGDLRHVIKAVNSLPSNHTGKLTVLINDGTMVISCRNLILLSILGTIEDEALAANVALHFWYSLLLPSGYKHHVKAAVAKFLDRLEGWCGPQPPFALGPQSDVVFPLWPGVVKWLSFCADSSMTPEYAKQEYGEVRNRPSQKDYISRLYYNLKPSHRVAFQRYRQTGIVLPFSASVDEFTEANQSLFMMSGRWFQTDLANPLYGWNIMEIVESGKAHGVPSEDLYGCLYFHLSDQLRSFHQRLRQCSISFKIMGIDARQLSLLICDGLMADYKLPPTIRFDRVFVSNIFDQVYLGIRGVLQAWEPLLAQTTSAAIVGYLMNWFSFEPDGEPKGAQLRAIKRQLGTTPDPPSSLKGMNEWCFKTDEMDLLYDNSGPLGRYLKKQGLDAILRETGLQLRKQHAIVPQRFGTSLGASASALPAFRNDEEKYLYVSSLPSNTMLYSQPLQMRPTAATWHERFIEFTDSSSWSGVTPLRRHRFLHPQTLRTGGWNEGSGVQWCVG